MPQITAVKETKRGRLALFVDGEFAFSLDPETFADADLHEEDEIESFRLEELRRLEAAETYPVPFPGEPTVKINTPVRPIFLEQVTVETFGEEYPEPEKC